MRLVAPVEKPQAGDLKQPEVGDLNELLTRTEALVTNISALADPKASVGDEEPEDEPQTIVQLDRALAAKMDKVLAAEPSAVETVLDGVFEEKAAIVQQLGTPSVNHPSDAPATIAAAPAPRTVASERVRADHTQPIVAEAPAPRSVVNDPGAPSAILESTNRSGHATRAVFQAVAAPLVLVLMILNFPLRLVPARLRLIVDWAAITLLAWVPIVWMLVLVTSRGSIAGAGSADHSTVQPYRATSQ
jgi:hypothetical protein